MDDDGAITEKRRRAAGSGKVEIKETAEEREC